MLPKSTLLQSGPRSPLLSVVTVVFRDDDGLERTLRSLQAISFPYEVVVVEGESAETGSAVETVRKVETLTGRQVCVIQGQDAGPYDAMNRGILASHGDWVWFVNAGDEVLADFDSGLLERALLASKSTGWVAGAAKVLSEDGTGAKIKPFVDARGVVLGEDTPCHQAILVSREAMMLTGSFDTRLKISADYKMMCQLALLFEPGRLDIPLVVFQRGGLSSRRWRRREWENFLVRSTVVRPSLATRLVDFLRTTKRIVAPRVNLRALGSRT